MAVFQVPENISQGTFDAIVDHFGKPIDVTSYGPGEECENSLLFWDISCYYPADHIEIRIDEYGNIHHFIICSICNNKTLDDLLAQKRNYDQRKQLIS